MDCLFILLSSCLPGTWLTLTDPLNHLLTLYTAHTDQTHWVTVGVEGDGSPNASEGDLQQVVVQHPGHLAVLVGEIFQTLAATCTTEPHETGRYEMY